ncbi:Ribonuclease BN [uncultured archaeon]|nr:Ribonuclease BN [uncultured archaeon]
MGKMKLHFMGTNGWFATETGNTTSALLETPDRYIVLDAGDGIQHLDELATDRKKPVDIFLSHFHIDHISGLHLLPKFRKIPKISIFGQTGTARVLSFFVAHPFTAPFSELKGLGINVSAHDLELGMNDMGSYNVECAPLLHADLAWGFRFSFPDGKIISYCTDTGPCENLVKLSSGADAMITECSMPPGTKTDNKWPHLTPEGAAKAAKEAVCKKLYLTHFAADFYNTLADRKKAEAAARKIFPNTVAAKDGLTFEI